MSPAAAQTTGARVFAPEERDFALRLIERIIEACPERQACSPDELSAQHIVRRELQQLDLPTEFVEFRFNDNLYEALALHFGIGTLGSLVARRAPLAGMAIHLAAGISYWVDSTQRGHLLRRMLPFRRSQNLLATLGASDEPKLRILIPAHIDAAFTGLLFRPELTRLLEAAPTPAWLSVLDQPLALVTGSQLLLAALDLATCAWPGRLPGAGWLRLGLSVPALLATLLNADMVLRKQLVPGANDDLTGVAAAVVLAQRLRGRLPLGVQVVFAVTGAEEAGLGGARALARSGRFDPARTVLLGLDGLSGGQLRYFEEGEIERVRVPPWLERLVQETARSDERFTGVERFTIPVGFTDVYAFSRLGFDGVCLGCVDPALGTPRHYHLPTDTPDHLDMDEFGVSVDFAEQLVWAIIEHRLGVGAEDGESP